MASFVRQTSNQLVERELDAGAISSPIQDLPPETLNEIFQWFLYLYYYGYYGEPISLALGETANYATLKLSWVCSRWRNLVIALPALWSVIVIRTGIKIGTNVCRREMLLHHISLSRDVPLTFILDGKGTITHKGSDLHFFVNTMLDNLHRWGSVQFRMSEKRNSGWLRTFLEEKRPAVDQLTNGDGQTQIRTLNGELVELQVPNLSRLRVKRTLPVQLLAACPKLHTLEIESLHLPDFSRCDFANLKTLHADLLYGTGVVVDVIRQTPMLDELHIGTDGLCIANPIYIIAEADRIPVSYPPYCSRVTSLSVSVNCLWPGAWKSIFFPNLKSLSITTSYYGYYEGDISTTVMTELVEMLSFSCSQAHLEDVHSKPLGLQKVTFKGIPAPIIVNILRSLPSVSQLTFTSAFGENMHDEVFALMSAKPFVVPHLRTLSLADSYCEHYTYTDPDDLDTYSESSPGLCCLPRDIFSMIKARNDANESLSCRLQQLVLPLLYFRCLNLESLQNQLAPLGVTVMLCT